MSIPNLSTPPPWPVRYIPALEDKSADADGNPLTGVGGYAHNGSPSSILAQSPAILKTVRVSGTGTAADADYIADPDATFSAFNGVDDAIDLTALLLAQPDVSNVTIKFDLWTDDASGCFVRGQSSAYKAGLYAPSETTRPDDGSGAPSYYIDGELIAPTRDALSDILRLGNRVSVRIEDLDLSDYTELTTHYYAIASLMLSARDKSISFDWTSDGTWDHVITPSQSSNGMEDQSGTLYPNQGTGNLKANNRWTNGANYVQSGPSATIDIGTESWTNATDSALPPLSDYSVGSLGSPAPTVDYLGSPFTELYTEFDGVGDATALDQIEYTTAEFDIDIESLASLQYLYTAGASDRAFVTDTGQIAIISGGSTTSYTDAGVAITGRHVYKLEWSNSTTINVYRDGSQVDSITTTAFDGGRLRLLFGKDFSSAVEHMFADVFSVKIDEILITPNPDGSGTMIDQDGTTYANEAGTPFGTGGELRRMDYPYLYSVPKIGQGGALLQWAKDGEIDLCHMKQLAAYDNAKQYTAAEYSKNLKFVNAETEDCGTAGLVPYPIDSGDGIGPSGEWYPVDEDKVYLVEE